MKNVFNVIKMLHLHVELLNTSSCAQLGFSLHTHAHCMFSQCWFAAHLTASFSLLHRQEHESRHMCGSGKRTRGKYLRGNDCTLDLIGSRLEGANRCKENYLLQDSARSKKLTLLPPASQGWGKVIFSVYVSVHTSTGGGVPHLPMGGYPIPGQDGGYPIPGPDRGQYPIIGPDGGIPHPRSGWGVPHPRSGQGYPPSRMR